MAAEAPRDDRDYPSGESTGARLKRWLVDNHTDRSIREEGPGKVTMDAGQLYDLLFEVAEWSYGNGVNDVRERHNIS